MLGPTKSRRSLAGEVDAQAVGTVVVEVLGPWERLDHSATSETIARQRAIDEVGH